jgi:hypothetical protein
MNHPWSCPLQSQFLPEFKMKNDNLKGATASKFVMTLVLLLSYQIASIFKIKPCKTSSPDKVIGDSNTSTSWTCR